MAQNQQEAQLLFMRWLFLIFLVIWTLTAIAAPVLAFCLTKSPLSFTLYSTIAPPIYFWHRFVKFLFPMDEKTFELKRLKVITRRH